jgi:hypothetical protein
VKNADRHERAERDKAAGCSGRGDSLGVNLKEKSSLQRGGAHLKDGSALCLGCLDWTGSSSSLKLIFPHPPQKAVSGDLDLVLVLGALNGQKARDRGNYLWLIAVLPRPREGICSRT